MCVNLGVNSSCLRSSTITDVCATTSDSVWVLGIQSVPLHLCDRVLPTEILTLSILVRFLLVWYFYLLFLVFCFLMTCRNINAENTLFFYVSNCVLLLHLDFLDKYILCFWRKMVSFCLNHMHFLIRTNLSVVRNNYFKQCRKYRLTHLSIY